MSTRQSIFLVVICLKSAKITFPQPGNHSIITKYLKCVQNKDVFTTILKSGLRPFVQHTKTDCYWGNGGNDTGCNYLGKAWDRVRENIYEQFLNENKSLDKNISKYIK